MNRHDRLGALGDGFSDRVGSDAPGLFVAVNQYGGAPGGPHCLCRGEKGVGVGDYLVTIAQAQTKRWAGQPWPVAAAGPANEGYMLIEAGVPTLCGFGPTGDNAHAPDEWLEIASLGTTIAMYCGIIHDYLQP